MLEFLYNEIMIVTVCFYGLFIKSCVLFLSTSAASEVTGLFKMSLHWRVSSSLLGKIPGSFLLHEDIRASEI